jgi:RNA polymerase sigma-70 factor (ECF subfamily)
MEKTADIELFNRFTTNNSERAFRTLFDRYFTQLSVYANKILADEEAAVDIVQSLFVRIYEQRQELHVTSVRSFLYQSVHNHCLNELKHRKVHDNYAQKAIPTFDTSSNNVEEMMAQSELEARLAYAINQLPTQCRRIFEMSRFEYISNNDIAEQLGLSKRTVETQITKALKILRQHLGDLFTTIAILYCL